MALLKGEGRSIYILKSPSLEDLSQRSTNVIFLQNPGIGPCRAIPLEQLTKTARKITFNRIKLKVAGGVPRGWSSDYTPPPPPPQPDPPLLTEEWSFGVLL